MNNFFKGFYFLFSLVIIGSISSCVKDDFDEPPVNGDDPVFLEEQIVSLNEVTALFVAGEFVKIDLDKYIQCVVIADDASGTFYKSLVVEDENSDLGITVLIDDNNLAAKFPIGRRVFIHLKDLWISDYENLLQLGFGPYDDDGSPRMAQIPGVLADEVIISGQFGLTLTPTVVSDFASLGSSQLSTLIQLDNVQFGEGSLGETYADGDLQFSVNHILTDCDGNEILVRNSGFASFANEPIPSGNGTLIAVYSIFRNDKQLLIRSLSDVQFTGDRCGGGTVSGERIDINDVRAKYTGSPVNGDAGYIEGVVISDFENGNITGRNLIIQDATGGIVVRFQDNHSFRLGDKIQVSTNGIEISEFNGTLQLNDVPSSSSSFIGAGSITPKEVSIADILQDFENYESTLVKISNPSVSGGTTFAGNLTVQDNSGSIALFTRNSASFANETVPSDIKSIIGIVGEFSNPDFNPQISMRNIEDIDGEGGTTTGTEGVKEEFNGGSDNNDIDINDWLNEVIKGERRWQKKSFDGNGYAQATAFNDTNAEMETWLISPEVDATKYSKLSFKTAQAFYNHDGLTVWVTSDYTGSVGGTSWTEINSNLAGASSADHDWVDSGVIDISSYGSKVRVAFKYVGSGTNDQTTSYRIDDVIITE